MARRSNRNIEKPAVVTNAAPAGPASVEDIMNSLKADVEAEAKEAEAAAAKKAEEKPAPAKRVAADDDEFAGLHPTVRREIEAGRAALQKFAASAKAE